MADPRLEVHRQALRQASDTHRVMVDQLSHVLGNLDDAHLPPIALSMLGEPARWRYENANSADLANLNRSIESTQDIADKMLANLSNYDAGELASDNEVYRLPDWSGLNPRPLFSSEIGSSTEPDYGNPKYSQLRRLGGVAGGIGAGTLLAYFGGPSLLQAAVNTYKDAKYFQAIRQPDAAIKYYKQASRLAQLSKSTNSVLKVGSRLSVAALAGVALWAAAMVSDDATLDQAIISSLEAAQALRDVFGTGAQDAHDQLRQAWSGSAKDAADPRLRDFVIAGLELADRFEKRAVALQKFVADLNRIHEITFVMSIAHVSLLIIYSCLPFSIAQREMTGMKLTSNVLTVIGLIAAAVAATTWLTVESNDFSTGPEKGIPQRSF